MARMGARGGRDGAPDGGRGDDEEPSPIILPTGRTLQRSGTLRSLPIALPDQARRESVASLTGLLADTISLLVPAPHTGAYPRFLIHHVFVAGREVSCTQECGRAPLFSVRAKQRT